MLTRPGPQSGQTVLVAAMVTMTLIFSIAGAFMIGASSLLFQQAPPRAAFQTDLDAQNVIATALAEADTYDNTGAPDGCGFDKSTVSSNPFASQLLASGGRCLAIGNVDLSTVSNPPYPTHQLPLTPAGNCSWAALPAPGASYSVWLNAPPNVTASLTTSGCGGKAVSCDQSFIPPQQFGFACDSKDTGNVSVSCPSTSPGCRLPTTARWSTNGATACNPGGGNCLGVMYSVVAPTSSGAWEEADLWVDYNAVASADEPRAVLTWEAQL